MKRVYDATDLAILKELRENCKQPIRALAKKLHIHPNTLLQRIKKLEKEEVIRKYQAEVNYSKIGYDLQAVILMRVRMGGDWETPIKKNIATIPQIMSLYPITGGPDVLAITRVKGKDELAFVLRKIQENRVISKTTTLLIVDTYKQPFEFNPLDNEAVFSKLITKNNNH